MTYFPIYTGVFKWNPIKMCKPCGIGQYHVVLVNTIWYWPLYLGENENANLPMPGYFPIPKSPGDKKKKSLLPGGRYWIIPTPGEKNPYCREVGIGQYHPVDNRKKNSLMSRGRYWIIPTLFFSIFSLKFKNDLSLFSPKYNGNTMSMARRYCLIPSSSFGVEQYPPPPSASPPEVGGYCLNPSGFGGY